MTRRKWRIKKVMAVPANWQGTPDHFYHFLLGYFMPVILWQERSGTTEFAVRDCGPMNPWFDLTRPGTEVEFMPPGIMLERVLSHRQERVILHDWDNPTRFHRKSISALRATVVSRVAIREPRAQGARMRITLLDRRASDDYFRSAAADSQGSGSDRRSLPNVDEIASSLAAVGEVAIVDSAAMTPADQVALMQRTDVLVAQHGAGLSNMVWLPPGSAVVEIRPPLPPTIDDIFRNLSSACRLAYASVEQSSEHAPVSAALVTQETRRLLDSPAALIPPMTGSLPLRVLRQLPRRL